jgi:hypothetical protein
MAYSDLNIPADIAAALAAMTPEASLVQLNTAIAKAETSQRYKIGDREVQRGDLRWMYPERARLEAQIARRRRGGIRFSRVVPC